MFISCGERLNDGTDVEVEADIDSSGNVSLLSVRPYISGAVGHPVIYANCVLEDLVSEQVRELENAMKSHAEDDDDVTAWACVE